MLASLLSSSSLRLGPALSFTSCMRLSRLRSASSRLARCFAALLPFLAAVPVLATLPAPPKDMPDTASATAAEVSAPAAASSASCRLRISASSASSSSSAAARAARSVFGIENFFSFATVRNLCSSCRWLLSIFLRSGALEVEPALLDEALSLPSLSESEPKLKHD
eukprot:scaffold234956_cov31-Tisochrysis_lutea.AAC.1